MRRISLLPALALSACGLLVNSNSISVSYDVDPQEFKHDFGADFGNLTGTFPTVTCAKDDDCGAIPGLPAGLNAACNTGAGQCQASYTLTLPVPVNLSTQQSFPSSVANSSVINDVQVSAVNYWAAMNSLTFDTPNIDIYVGGQSAMKITDAGVTELGTMPPITHGGVNTGRTDCGAGSPGTRDSGCSMPLTDAGKAALSILAKDFRTPFNILLNTTVTVQAGDAYPSGAIDLFLQPIIAFVIPL